MDFAHFSTKYDFLVSTLVKLQIFIPKNVKLTHNSTPDVKRKVSDMILNKENNKK